MRIGVVTGSRSEWGVLEPLVKRIHDDPDLQLQLYVTGSHLSPEFHLTVREISFPIYERLETLLSADTPSAQAKSIGVGVLAFTDALKSHPPNVLVVEGDRFETFAAVVAAYTLRIPIAHISGGDITRGSLDDGYRNSITHMATLHYPDHLAAADRILKLCDDVMPVLQCFGCLSLDGLKSFMEQRDGFIVAIHPANDMNDDVVYEMHQALKGRRGYYILPCADAGGRDIKDSLGLWFELQHLDCHSRSEFLYELGQAEFIIGNSSAGIVEAPALGTPTINIGNRQKGRPMASSIIQAEPTEASIREALEKVKELKPPFKLAYTGGNVAEKIVDHLKEWYHAH